MRSLKYRRILLKLSGEAFAGRGDQGLSEKSLGYARDEIKSIHEAGVEAALVVGGGNFLRGSRAAFLDRAVADQMGMLATVMNGLALMEALNNAGMSALLQSAIQLPWADPVQPGRARKALQNGEIVIFVGGTGNPFVTTDTAAAIRASEVGAAALLKATQVDGVYSSDPKSDPDAKRFDTLGFADAIEKKLAVMDMAAFDLCRQSNIPIVVFDFFHPGSLLKIIEGGSAGTLVS